MGSGRKIKKGGEEGKEKGTEFVLIRESELEKGRSKKNGKYGREMMGKPGNGKERKKGKKNTQKESSWKIRQRKRETPLKMGKLT